eukprot:2419402-Rhodomonas_salina.1
MRAGGAVGAGMLGVGAVVLALGVVGAVLLAKALPVSSQAPPLTHLLQPRFRPPLLPQLRVRQ